MALIGRKFGIASVGISCQAAYQITLNKDLIDALAGDVTMNRSTPFDWLLCGARSATRMIADRCFFPTDFDGPLIDPKPYWPRYGVHFWHAKTEDVPDFLAKFSHMRENWDQLLELERIAFVVANTQNNVTRVLADRQPIDVRITIDDAIALYMALAIAFKGPQVELHVVTAAGVDGGLRAHPLLTRTMGYRGRAPVTIHKIGRDESQWAGDQRAWVKVFAAMLT